MDIKIREYKDTDKFLLLELTRKLGEHSKSLDSLDRIKNLPGFFEASLEETLANVAKYQGKIWFALDANKVVGFVIVVIRKQSEVNKLEIGQHTLGEVLDLYVEKEYRRIGIGTKLLARAEDYFKEKACDSIWIGLFAANEDAHSLYKKFGFVDRQIGMLKQIQQPGE